MNNLKKNLIFPLMLIAIFGALYLVVYRLGFYQEYMSNIPLIRVTSKEDNVLGAKDEQDFVTIAICPTYQFLLNDLQAEDYTIVKTHSTAESISLLRSGDVDLVISGRTPLPSEKNLEVLVLDMDDRFSFLSENSIVINTDDLKLETVYTDQDSEKLRDLFQLVSVEIVENVYEYLDKRLVVTSWDNTDFARASVVHVLNMDGSRHINSRTIAIYSLEPNNINDFSPILEKILNKES